MLRGGVPLNILLRSLKRLELNMRGGVMFNLLMSKGLKKDSVEAERRSAIKLTTG